MTRIKDLLDEHDLEDLARDQQLIDMGVQLHDCQEAVADLSDQVDSVTVLMTAANKEKEVLKLKIIELLAEIAVLKENPVTIQMFAGACPEAGGATLAAAQTVITKWGVGAAVRQFMGTAAAPRPADAGITHHSFKPTLAQITTAWVTTITKDLKSGDVVEVWHEADKKVTDNILTKADVVGRKNAFYDIVKQVRPDLYVANTLTGWLFDPKSGKNPDDWAVVKADILGVDADGVRPTALPYTNYEAETARAVKFLEDHPSYKYFSVPEFGCPRIPALDADGTKRATYHDYYMNLWTATGKCLYVTLYEYNSSPNYSLETPAEISGFKAWV